MGVDAEKPSHLDWLSLTVWATVLRADKAKVQALIVFWMHFSSFWMKA
jgi:hypothetical protein